MGTIKKQIDKDKNLTVYTVEGKVLSDEYKNAIHEFYEQGPVTAKVLWDLTKAQLDHLESTDVLYISQTPRPFLSAREDGKTAIIAPTDLAFGLARMYEFTSSEGEMPFDTKVFRTADEALQWLSPD